MLFSSPFFLFIYLPLFLAAFFLAKGKSRDYILLMGSLAFYFWGEPVFCLVALVSALLDYLFCKKIHLSGPQSKKAQVFLTLGIVANVFILIYYKYTNFFLSNFFHFFSPGNTHFQPLDIILPIGVSFIVFEKITYLVDVYRGQGKPAANLLHYLNYVFLFPKLLAGPIIKYHEIEKQLQSRLINSEQFIQGCKRFLLGLAKKVFIADTCGSIANQVFALENSHLGFSYAWLGILCFTLQIYFDFSAYSDMALGLARALGFNLKENFNLPYIATSFTDFWRRWHISLSSWIREYLYLPLGGNRVSQSRVYLNLWICFLLSGLWHGANWTFVLWGAYNGMFLVLDKLVWLKASLKLPSVLRSALTLFLVMLGWVIFRATNFEQAQAYFYALSHPAVNSSSYIDITPDIFTALFIGSFLVLLPLFPQYTRVKDSYLAWQGRTAAETLVIASLGFLAICKVVGNSYTPFLYFKF